jgi:hypothetical protein
MIPRPVARFLRPGAAALALVAAAMVVPALPSAALAQPAGEEVQRLTTPLPTRADNPPTFINVLMMVIIVGGAVGAALIPSKRGHQD